MLGKRLGSQAQLFVLNLLTYFQAEKDNGGPLLPLNSVNERVAAALQVSLRTVYTVKGRIKRNPVLSSPGKKRPRSKPKTSNMPETTKMEVRNTIYDMYKQKMHVTLETLSNMLKLKEIVEISRSSLAMLLKDIGFKFKKDDNRRALMEKLNIVSMRSAFLRRYVTNLTSQFRKVVFLDETWIFSRGNKTKSWQDDNIKSVRKPEGYDGKRFIVLHAGTSEGFIEGASLLFASKSAVGDYHGEMNSNLFKQWVTDKLISNLKEPSLIVMDNAPYHSVVLNKTPNTSSKKMEILEWLQANNVTCSPEMTKYELLQLVKGNTPEKIYEIDELLRQYGHEVLRLPPYHCQFNAIELIWAKAKRYYDAHIGRDGYSDDSVREMWNEALHTCDKNVWNNCVRHTEKLINEWYDRENHFINLDINPIIISVNSNDTSESETDTDTE